MCCLIYLAAINICILFIQKTKDRYFMFGDYPIIGFGRYCIFGRYYFRYVYMITVALPAVLLLGLIDKKYRWIKMNNAGTQILNDK